MQIIDGKEISEKIYSEIKQKINETDRTPKLGIILATDDPSSEMYVKLKGKKAEELGIETDVYKFSRNDEPEDVIERIEILNEDETVNGILVQIPLYKHLQNFTSDIVNTVDPLKDVDGLTAIQQGFCSQLIPNSMLTAVVEAVLESLNYTLPDDQKINWQEITQSPELIKGKTALRGKNVVIINNTYLIGKPLAMLFSNFDATVTIAHKETKDLKELIKQADILVTATGETGIIDYTMVKENSTIIDITSVKKGDQILGDVIISDELKEKIDWITPVPGGVGPLTIACLLRNVVRAYSFQKVGNN